MTAIEWTRDALRDHAELALFLTLAAGYLIGRFSDWILQTRSGCRMPSGGPCCWAVRYRNPGCS